MKANYGQYWWNPGTVLSEDVNPNPEVWNRRYVWNDLNGDLHLEPGEEGRLNSSGGGLASAALAPDLKDTYTQEVALWLERELMRELRRAHRRRMARRAPAGDAVQREPAILRLQRADDDAAIPVPTACIGNGDDGATLRRSIWRRVPGDACRQHAR